MIFPESFIFVEKTDSGVTKLKTCYNYKLNKIVIATGSNFNGKDAVVKRLYGQYSKIITIRNIC